MPLAHTKTVFAPISLLEQSWKSLFIAGLYLLAGLFSQLLPLPPGYASPVWPAAGVAVAMLLIWGPRCWPGVWLGALLMGLWSLGNSTLAAVSVSVLTASAATGQAWLGAWLARRYLQGRHSFASDKGLVLFLLSAGPLVCLFSASFGTAVLLASGKLAPSALVHEWLRWWSGDTLGVLLFTPLILLLWPGTHPLRVAGGSVYRYVLPLAVTAALLMLGHVSLAHLADLQARQETRLLKERISDEAMQDIAAALSPLEGLAHFIALEEGFSHEHFRTYIQRFIRHPAIVSVDWAPRITQAQRAEFEAAVTRQGFPGYRIAEQDADGRMQAAERRAEYFPILFREGSRPLGPVPLGFDHASDSLRRQAMDSARANGKVIGSDPTRLVHTDRLVSLLYVPAWQPAKGSSQQAQDLAGYVVAAVDIQRLFDPLVRQAEAHRVFLRLRDISAGRAPRIFVDSLPDGTPTDWHHDFHFVGRTWRLEMKPDAQLRQAGAAKEEHLFLGFAMLTAFLAVFSTLSSSARNAHVSRQVARRTEQLQHELKARSAAEQALRMSGERHRRLIELSPFGILVQCEGHCTFVNTSTLTMFGASRPEELLGRSLFDLIHPDSHTVICERMARRARHQDVPDSALVRYRRLDGTDSWMELTSVVYEHEGRYGSLLMLNDFSARLRAEEQRDRFFTLSLDLFCIVGSDGYFQSVNPSFTRTLGWSEEELLTRPIMEFIHPDDVEATLGEFRRFEQGVVSRAHENRFRCKDGSWRWLSWSGLPQPGGIIFATGHDITAQKLADRQLMVLNAELEQRIGERNRALAELQAERENIRAVLEHLPECVVTLDSRGIVQSVSSAIEPLLGYRPEELVGDTLSRLWALLMIEPYDEPYARAVLNGERPVATIRREVTGRHKAGHAVNLELYVSEYRVHDERFLIGTLRDIRERKALIASLTQAREEAEQARAQAEQASQAKSAFLAAMSHEIRTPMNGVIGLLDVLAQDGLPPHQGELVETIRESSNSLLGIIDDILDISKIEAGKLDIECAPVPLAERITSLCSTLQPLARSRGVTLQLDIAEDIPHWVQSDATRLRQILYNLIGNAIKFSGGRSERPGRVAVCVRLAGDDPSRVAISVADNGIGMTPEQLARLFTPFTQAESATTRRFGGTGLGLAICKRLVALLDGEITVSSTPDSGTTFTVTLPFETAQAPAQVADSRRRAGTDAATSAEPEAAAFSGRILVAEDNQVNRKVIQEQLTLLGYAFEMAATGSEALEKWRQGGYSLILTDLHMPDMDGYQLAECIRREERGQDRTPILALTANALRGEAQRARQAGMDDYLTKPIRLAVLEDVLAGWLRRAAPVASAPVAGAFPAGPDELLDKSTLGAWIGDNWPLIREILSDYAESLETSADQLRQAFDDHDTAAVGALAHALVSSSHSVGATRMGQLCAELEQAARSGDQPGLARGLAAFAPLHAATAARIAQLLAEDYRE